MTTKFPEFFAALGAPFQSHEVKSRSQSGRQLHYVTARVVMNRLDNVAGPEGWWDEYSPQANSVICRLTVRLPDGSEITKVDAGGFAGMADQGDDDKSGYSDAFKRAAVKFGVGRLLYSDGVPDFVQEAFPDMRVQSSGSQDRDQPQRQQPSTPREPNHAPQGGGQPDYGNVPRTGRQLYPWIKDMEKRFEVDLLKYIDHWGVGQGFPRKFTEYDDEQAKLAAQEAVRKLDAAIGVNAPAY